MARTHWNPTESTRFRLLKLKESSLVPQIRGLRAIIEEFRKIDPEMQMQTALTFLLVAQNEGISVREVSERVGISGAAASRNVSALADIGRRGRLGHNLISSKRSVEDRRSVQLFLTPKGRSVLHTLALEMSGTA